MGTYGSKKEAAGPQMRIAYVTHSISFHFSKILSWATQTLLGIL